MKVIPIEEVIRKDYRFEVDDRIIAYDKNWKCIVTDKKYAVFAECSGMYMNIELDKLMILWNNPLMCWTNPLDKDFSYQFASKSENIPYSEEKIWEPIDVDINQVLNETI